MNDGKKFEHEIKRAAIEQGIDYTRLKDAGFAAEQILEGGRKRFTPRHICDCILIFKRSVYFIEVKHRTGSLSFEEIKQFDDLKKKWIPDQHIYSGVLCKLYGETFLVPTLELEKMRDPLHGVQKKSFNQYDADRHGIAIKYFVPPKKRTPRPNLREALLLCEYHY